MGGYKVQGKENREAENLIDEAVRIEASGSDILLLYCVSSLTAKKVTEAINIPIIGIGAGSDVDDQILVLYDILGLTPGKLPKFSKNYMTGKNTLQAAIASYIQEVNTTQ